MRLSAAHIGVWQLQNVLTMRMLLILVSHGVCSDPKGGGQVNFITSLILYCVLLIEG